MVAVLRGIWELIVRPVVEQLRSIGLPPPPKRSRIWWSPTGAASRLPLHAAGPYMEGKENLPQMFISSYTPTLATLIRAREAWKTNQASSSNSKPCLLLVGQPSTPNEPPLPGVKTELSTILTHAPTATVLESEEATGDAVLSSLRRHDWVHLACHGHHDPHEPFLSHFTMHDRHLTFRDIISNNHPRVQLAFLSACHSAKVSETLPDEALHPASGMLLAGYQSVIGTMWALEDGVGARLADRFYELMLGGRNGPKDCSKAAEALARALDSLGDSISLSQRINIVHFGVSSASRPGNRSGEVTMPPQLMVNNRLFYSTIISTFVSTFLRRARLAIASFTNTLRSWPRLFRR